MIICVCKNVSDKVIKQMLKNGTPMKQIIKETGVCSECCKCAKSLKELGVNCKVCHG